MYTGVEKIGCCNLFGAATFTDGETTITVSFDDDCIVNQPLALEMNDISLNQFESRLLSDPSSWARLKFFVDGGEVSQDAAIERYVALV